MPYFNKSAIVSKVSERDELKLKLPVSVSIPAYKQLAISLSINLSNSSVLINKYTNSAVELTSIFEIVRSTKFFGKG